MKFFLISLVTVLMFSCGVNTNENEVLNEKDDLDNIEVNDMESVFEDPVEVEQYENKENFSISFKTIEDGFDPYSDIIFGDTLGNVYYSKKHSGTTLKNGSPLKDLLKLDPDGILVWQTPFSLYDIEDMYVYDYEFSLKSMSIFVSGTYSSKDSLKMFLAKISADGTQSWLKFWGTEGEGWATPFSIATDSDENIYVGGRVIGALEGTIAAEDNNNNTRNSDAFVSKWDKNGNLLWSKQSGKLLTDVVMGVTVDKDDKIYVTGTENVDHGNYATNSSNFGTSMFLSKLNSDGNEIWRIEDYDKNDQIHGIDVGVIGEDIVVLGQRCILPPAVPGDFCYLHPYIKKYDKDSHKIWEKRWRGKENSDSVTTGVKLNISGNRIYTILDAWERSGDNSDIMITIFDSDGTNLSSQILKSKCQDYPGHISILPDGLVMITGITDGWFGSNLSTAECEVEIFRPFVMILEPKEE